MTNRKNASGKSRKTPNPNMRQFVWQLRRLMLLDRLHLVWVLYEHDTRNQRGLHLAAMTISANNRSSGSVAGMGHRRGVLAITIKITLNP